MTGAIAGAYHGASQFPKSWIETLENDEAGRDDVIILADKLFEMNKTLTLM